jgi:hypothetical protein
MVCRFDTTVAKSPAVLALVAASRAVNTVWRVAPFWSAASL